MMMSAYLYSILDQQLKLDLYSASSHKQQSAGGQYVFAHTLKAACPSKDTVSANFVVFTLT